VDNVRPNVKYGQGQLEELLNELLTGETLGINCTLLKKYPTFLLFIFCLSFEVEFKYWNNYNPGDVDGGSPGRKVLKILFEKHLNLKEPSK